MRETREQEQGEGVTGASKALADAVATAPVGARVWFEAEKRPYTVQARSHRFLVCTKPFFRTVLYTIIDLNEMVRGPENLVFGMGAETREQCERMVDRLEGRGQREIDFESTEVSRRHRIDLDVRRVENARTAEVPRG